MNAITRFPQSDDSSPLADAYVAVLRIARTLRQFEQHRDQLGSELAEILRVVASLQQQARLALVDAMKEWGLSPSILNLRDEEAGLPFDVQVPVSAVHSLTLPLKGTITIHSLMELEQVALETLVHRLAYESDSGSPSSLAVLERLPDGDIGLAGEIVDELIPGPEDWAGLLTFVWWNPAFFTDPPEYYAPGNRLDGAHLTYECIYCWLRNFLQESWRGCIEQARQLIVSQASPSSHSLGAEQE